MYPCFTRKQDALHHYMSLNVSTFDTKLIDRLLIHAEKTMHNLLNRENHVIGPSVSCLWYTAWWDEMTINYNSLIDWIIDWLTVFHLFWKQEQYIMSLKSGRGMWAVVHMCVRCAWCVQESERSCICVLGVLGVSILLLSMICRLILLAFATVWGFFFHFF